MKIRFRKIALILLSIAIFVSIFLFDIIKKAHDPESSGLLRIRVVLIVLGFLAIYYLLDQSERKKDKSITSKIGNILILSAGLVVSFGSLMLLSNVRFVVDNFTILPDNYFTVIYSNFISIIIISLAIYLLILIKNLILSYRRKQTKRNFIILIAFIFLTSAVYNYYAVRGETSAIQIIFFILTIILMLINSFRLPWVVYISRKEKYYTITYCLILIPLFIVATTFNNSNFSPNNLSLVLLYYSPISKEFVSLITLFASIYFGITFISTIFHIPTQDIFDRKIVEISSLHNLSKLVTQVFDFKDLVDNIMNLSLGVCEADCAWLEMRKQNKTAGKDEYQYETSGIKNISEEEISILHSHQDIPFYKEVFQDNKDRKMIYISDLLDRLKDKSTSDELLKKIRSLVVLPLISHSELIGILYVGKSFPFGFDKEYLNIINTFADQVTISLENSKLIEKSLEKERMERELLLAQKMQRRLLPHKFPTHKNIDLAAISIPAYEVGGDYYDFSVVSDNKLGIIVGDVSGKGISAAFYMAVLKGIFQSLSKVFITPKEFLLNANLSLIGNIDKKSFISIVYAVVDLNEGILSLCRAGHCPMIYLTKNGIEYFKPDGLGVGLDNGKIFNEITKEVDLLLEENSFCVFYTDGIPEARSKNGEEFGFDRIVQDWEWSETKSAEDVCNEFLSNIKKFTQNENEYDDITLVVFKWNGKNKP